MAGYTPAFDSIYDGTLYGRWPAAAVMATLIPLIDAKGCINRSFEAIAGMTGWPMDLLKKGIEELEQPDPHSRTPAEDGRRLIKLDPARPWGWRVVNHGLYREKARKMAYDKERTESGRDAERKRAERSDCPDVSRDVPTCPANSRDVPLSDSDSNARENARKRATRLPGDFEPDLEYARKTLPDINAEEEFARFRDYWAAKSGAAATKADWAGTWRNWVRNCRDSGRYAKQQQGKAIGAAHLPFAKL